MEIKTWGDLADAIRAMDGSQKSQQIQCVKPTAFSDGIHEALPGIAIATVEEMGFFKFRSSHDNKYQPNDVVLLLDDNPFGVGGELGYEWDGDERAFDTPIYGPEGRTSDADQLSPKAKAGGEPFDIDDLPSHSILVASRRADNFKSR
jgi:hypothetical protein